ncbi:MAG: hypothetical protein PHQ28_00035 [Mycobacterium sp.]|nr:hypothetical protein [Mycobacterium sp.]
MALAMVAGTRGGRRQRRLAVAVCAVIGLGFLGFGAIAQFPITVADTAAAWIFGGRGGQYGAPRIPDICAKPPAPEQQPVTPDDIHPAVDPLPAGLGPDGRPTEQALALMAQIPAGADVTVAQGWILYGLAHPNGDDLDFAGFADSFQHVAERLSRQAAALDVVSTMDPKANYAPYLLLAQAAAYQLMRQGSVAANDHQRNALISGLNTTCEGVAGPVGAGRG